MRFLLSAALIVCAVPLTASGAAAADLDYEYGSPPPRVYERRVELPPPVVYDRPILRPRPYSYAYRHPYAYGRPYADERPYAYGDAYRSYRRPYAEAYEDFGYQRPQRPRFDYGPY